MQALLVVLDDELPVARQLVGVAGTDDETLGPMACDVRLDAGEEAFDGRSIARDVDHHPPMPLLDGDRHQAVVGTVEAAAGSNRGVASKAPSSP